MIKVLNIFEELLNILTGIFLAGYVMVEQYFSRGKAAECVTKSD